MRNVAYADYLKGKWLVREVEVRHAKRRLAETALSYALPPVGKILTLTRTAGDVATLLKRGKK